MRSATKRAQVDAALLPFLDALAALLAAQEQRLADERRALRDTAQKKTSRSTKGEKR